MSNQTSPPSAYDLLKAQNQTLEAILAELQEQRKTVEAHNSNLRNVAVQCQTLEAILNELRGRATS